MMRKNLGLAAVVCLAVVTAAARADVIDNGNVLEQSRILIDAGQTESAQNLLESYISSGGPRMDYAEYLVALTTFSDTDADAPRKAVESLRRRYPDSKFSALALYKLAQFYRVSLRDPARAVSAYSQFLSAYPADPMAREAQMWLCSALIDAGQYDRAIAAVHQALAIYQYERQEKSILDGLLDFAKQNTGRQSSGGVTIDVQPPSQEIDVRPPAENPASPEDAPAIRPSGPISPPIETSEGSPPVSLAVNPPHEAVWTAATGMPRMSADSTPTVLMNYLDADIVDVLNSLAEELGLTFIKDDEVQGKITIINPRKLTPSDAVYLLESILELKGFTMVRSGRVFKIIPAQKSYSKGIDVYQPDQQPPTDDRPITRMIRLNHSLAQDVVQVLQPLLGEAGSIQADISKNSIIVSGMASNVARVEIIARTIDESGSTDQKDLFLLKFLSAAEALPLVQKLLATTQPENLGSLKLVAGPTTSHLFASGPLDMIFKVREILKLVDVPGYKEESLKVYSLKQANAEKLAGFLETLLAKGLAASAVEGAPTRPGVVTADRMTNSIVVLASRAFHDVIAPLIDKLDYDGFATFRVQVVPLKNAVAADLSTKFENIVARGLGTRGEAYSNQILIQSDPRLNALIFASNSQSLLKTLTSLATALDRPAEEQGPRTVVYYLENAEASALVTVLSDIFSKSDAAQSTKIVGDKGTNSLVIVALRENYAAVMETVMKLDIAPYQVLVEAIILEVTLDQTTDLGVDFTWHKTNVDFDRRTSGTSLENLAFNGIKQAVVKDNNQLNGIIQALVSKSNTKVLATPRIFARNAQEASILIGDQVPVKTGSSTTTGGVTQNTFEYKDVGIKLKVTPHINRKRQTVLDITQEIKTIRSTSTSTENPTFQTREAKTNAVLDDGQTVVIGGLIRTDRTKQQSKVPVLGDLPFVGAAFRSMKDVDVRTELMIFITPTVVGTPADMTAVIDAQKKYAEKAGFGKTNLDPDTPSRPNFIQDFILK